MTLGRELPTVAVLDGWSPGLAFARSLSAAGITVRSYASPRSEVAVSRSVEVNLEGPWWRRADDVVGWLVDEVEAGRIDLVAPTSDDVCFAIAAAERRTGRPLGAIAAPDAIDDCIFKARFSEAASRAGLPTPKTATVTALADALTIADTYGYPVVLKPRGHPGIGDYRGTVVRSDGELEAAFIERELLHGNAVIRQIDPDIGFPLVQEYIDRPSSEVVSLSGLLHPDGDLLALTHARRTRGWGATGIGTEFRLAEPSFFTAAAVDAVRNILGAGLFEFEVIVDHATEEMWALDLNPRGFGQMMLDIAQGHDLPMLWYNAVTGLGVASAQRARPRRPEVWRMGVPDVAGRLVGLTLGPRRHREAVAWARDLLTPRVGPSFRWNDPAPSLMASRSLLRHPGGLFRPHIAAARDRRRRTP